MQAQVINSVFAGIGKKLSTKFGDFPGNTIMFLEHQEHVCLHVLITSKMKVSYSVQNQFPGGPKNVF